jgi:hypothetical protein
MRCTVPTSPNLLELQCDIETGFLRALSCLVLSTTQSINPTLESYELTAKQEAGEYLVLELGRQVGAEILKVRILRRLEIDAGDDWLRQKCFSFEV